MPTGGIPHHERDQLPQVAEQIVFKIMPSLVVLDQIADGWRGEEVKLHEFRHLVKVFREGYINCKFLAVPRYELSRVTLHCLLPIT